MAAVTQLATRPARLQFLPGDRVAQGGDSSAARFGTVADEGEMRDFQIGPPGGPTRYFALVLWDDAEDTEYADKADLRLIAGGAR